MSYTIEEKYKELSELDHILMRPGMYVGSTKEEESNMFIYNDDASKIELKTVKYVPAMLKVIDEVISNSCDEYRRKDNLGLNHLSIFIKDRKIVKVYDNGGIPVVKHKDAQVFVPEFIFGRLRTSSNYNDVGDDRIVVGTNGVGSVLCNVFSTKFSVTTLDKKKKFHRSWSQNMKVLNDDLEVIPVGKKNNHFTEIEFELDFDKFDCDQFSDDFIQIIGKRCIDAAIGNFGLTVDFIVEEGGDIVKNYTWKFKSFDEYFSLYDSYLDLDNKIGFSDSISSVYIFPNSNINIGFVNGCECSNGTHIKVIRQAINSYIVDYLKGKDKIDISIRNVDNKYSVFCNINVVNPSYNSQTKDTLITPSNQFTSKTNNDDWVIPVKFLKSIINNGELIESIRDWYRQKCIADDQRALRKLNSEAKKGLKRPDKYITCSSKNKNERQLWLFEGDSARAGFRDCRNPNTQSAIIMRGVPKNVYNMSPIQIMKNEVFNDIVTVSGLKWGTDFNIDDLKFSKIVIASDADVDGDKIASLLLVFFNNWPELFEKGIVVRSISPIIISRKGKDCKTFYRIEDFKKVESSLKGYVHKYTKGLGGLNAEETKKMYREPKFLYFTKDVMTDNMIRKWFLKGDSDTRKTILSISE